MRKIVFTLFIITLALNASYQEINGENLYKVKIQNKDFNTIYINLKDEILSRGYVIVHEIDLADSANSVAKALDKKMVLTNGKTILICKSSFALEMLQENIDNITYCPMAISVYENEKNSYISFKKYKSYKYSNKIAKEINSSLKDIILESLD